MSNDTSFNFYHDSALTEPVTALNPIAGTQIVGGAAPADDLIYFGSSATGTKAQVYSDPGVEEITVSVVDADAGTGAPATEIKLALSSLGLDSATAGAALVLTTSVNSGVANAVPIHLRRASALTAAAVYTDVSLATQELVESPV